ncbi:TIGR04255 family protein [Mesorhizobium japonicum]|uniref:TIGR04255 family protein n=1 Tax=Mesorhizobium japonicum TaxID=2066070 RepID=UPI003B5C4A2D
MKAKLPTRLKKEPLIEALFETQFNCSSPASILLPGLLFNKLGEGITIESLPLAQLPKAARDRDPNLKFQPLSRLKWGQFFVNISDYSVSVSCGNKYPGWHIFKPAILEVIKILAESKITNSISRYSVKYIDLIPMPHVANTTSMANLELTIAGQKLINENFQIRAEIMRDDFINSLQLASNVRIVNNTGETKEGFVVDIDTISMLPNVAIDEFLSSIEDKLDKIHQINKQMFFDCLSKDTLASLEPDYE